MQFNSTDFIVSLNYSCLSQNIQLSCIKMKSILKKKSAKILTLLVETVNHIYNFICSE